VASLALEQKIWRDAELLVAARVTVAAVEGGRARRLPREVREKFLRIQNAQ